MQGWVNDFLIQSRNRLPTPTKETPRPAISAIAYNLTIIEAIHRKSHLELQTV